MHGPYQKNDFDSWVWSRLWCKLDTACAYVYYCLSVRRTSSYEMGTDMSVPLSGDTPNV